jgi:ubiquinone/menaquinone biosynthesis C-methylase UbiE
MDPKFQRRIQRYGWDRAVGAYESGWQAQLAPAHDLMLDMVAPQPGERVLDVACGTGLVSLRLAAAVGERGSVVGTDISERMVEAASSIAGGRVIRHVQFLRHGAEAMPFPDASFDAAMCALGLMYVPDPVRALCEMRRLLKPGGRVAVAVWGARQRCGWAEVFPITDARVASEVCPLFFQLGTGETLAGAMAEAGFADIRRERLPTMLATHRRKQHSPQCFAAVRWRSPTAASMKRPNIPRMPNTLIPSPPTGGAMATGSRASSSLPPPGPLP